MAKIIGQIKSNYDILLESSQSSSVATDGEILYADRGEKQDRFTVDPVKTAFFIVKIYPSDTVTFCGISDNNNANVTVVFNWLEPL